MAYHIVVEEILSREVIVEAKTIEEAMAQVKAGYQNGDIVLAASDFVQVEFYQI